MRIWILIGLCVVPSLETIDTMTEVQVEELWTRTVKLLVKCWSIK